MRKIFICICVIPFLYGCAPKKNQLLKSGYYSNGEKFAYCKNPNLFKTGLIDFINKKSVTKNDAYIISAYDVESFGGSDYNVTVPLTCIGKFKLSDGNSVMFNLTISIPELNSPRLDKIQYTKIAQQQQQKSSTTVRKSSQLCLGNSSQPGKKSCFQPPDADDYYEQFPKTKEDFERNQRYMRNHTTYTCRSLTTSYADGARVREYIVFDPSECR